MAKKIITVPDRRHEAELWSEGFGLIAGVDEVGRGAWAGPVVAAAVVLPRTVKLAAVRDSKLLNRRQRQMLAAEIKQLAASIGIGWSTAREIDELGLSSALALAGARALGYLIMIDGVLLDGSYNYLPKDYQVKTVVKGDNCCLNIAAASIIAKVARDNYMYRLHQLHPRFGFDTNVGYGTKHHARQLVDGITPWHRRSFAPVKLSLSYVN